MPGSLGRHRCPGRRVRPGHTGPGHRQHHPDADRTVSQHVGIRASLAHAIRVRQRTHLVESVCFAHAAKRRVDHHADAVYIGQEPPKRAGTNQMSVEASDLPIEAHGPGRYTGALFVSVRNNGTATQHGVTVVVVPPAIGTVVDSYQPDGIDHCEHVRRSGTDSMLCQVNDRGPGTRTSASFHVRMRVPMVHPSGVGSVSLHGIAKPVTHPEDTSTVYPVDIRDASWPTQHINIRPVVSDPLLHRQSDGTYRGTVTVQVANLSAQPVDSVALRISPPQSVTVHWSAGHGPTHCSRIGSDQYQQDMHFPSGLRCSIPVTNPGARGSFTFRLSSNDPDTNGTLGVVQLTAAKRGTNLKVPTPNAMRRTYQVGFAKAGGTGAGTGTGHDGPGSLPVTGLPLAMLAGGGAAVVVGGAGLALLARRRRGARVGSPTRA